MKTLSLMMVLCLFTGDAFGGNRWCGSYCQPTYCKPPVVQQITKQYPTTNNATTHSVSISNVFNYAQPSAQQGSTLYGALDSSYNIDLGALMTLHGRTISHGVDGMSALASQMGGILSDEGERRARVAEILATGQSAARIAEAVKASGGRSSSTSITQQGQFVQGGGGYQQPQGNGNGGGSALNMNQLQGAIEQVILTRCAECHNESKKEGGFNLKEIFNYDAVSMDKVMSQIRSGKMPKDGERLTFEEEAPLVTLWQIINQGRQGNGQQPQQ